MKNLKKLSLEDGINREAEEIEKKVKENKEIEEMTVSEDICDRGDCCNYHFDLWQCYDQCRK